MKTINKKTKKRALPIAAKTTKAKRFVKKPKALGNRVNQSTNTNSAYNTK